jgi:hypothetical protein
MGTGQKPAFGSHAAAQKPAHYREPVHEPQGNDRLSFLTKSACENQALSADKRSLMDVRQNPFELIQAVVRHHQFALAGGAVLKGDFCA